MLTAKAVARMRGSTTLTMVELIGPVDANRQSSAATIAVQYTAGVAAVNAFTLALEKDASHVKSHINLSRVLIEQGRAQDALPHVEAALVIDSTSGETIRLLGRVKRELGDSAGAIAAYQRAIVLDERDVWSMNNLAKLYIAQGNYDDAVGPLARAVEIDSTTPAFRNNLGVALGHSSRVDLGALARSFEEQIKTWR